MSKRRTRNQTTQREIKMLEIHVLIAGVGALLIYADVGMYYVINNTVKGYFGSWKHDLKSLVT